MAARSAIPRPAGPGGGRNDDQELKALADPRRQSASATSRSLLDLTVTNLALPSAQHALGFTIVDRQWIVTAYSLSFGSLLLFCGGRPT